MRKIKEGIIDLEECVTDDIALQCDTEEDEFILIEYLDSLGVTTYDGQELCSFTCSFGEDNVSYWSDYAEDGFYIIRKTRLNRYYLIYSNNHNGTTLNISNHIEEIKEEVVEKKKNIILKILDFIFV